MKNKVNEYIKGLEEVVQDVLNNKKDVLNNPQYDITIIVNKKAITVGFNADTYDTLCTLLKEGI